jgi:hypothetical protein
MVDLEGFIYRRETGDMCIGRGVRAEEKQKTPRRQAQAQ